MNNSRSKLIMALESVDIAVAAVTILLLIVPPMGLLAGFCSDSIYLVAALLVEGLVWAGLGILKLHFEAAREYAVIKAVSDRWL
jgi:hypothetical protein